MKHLYQSALGALLALGLPVSAQETLTIDLSQRGATVAPSMYGIFFEEISHAGDGGLYAELVQNRSFDELDMPEGYHAEGDKLYPKPVPNHLTGQTGNPTYQWTTEPVPAWSVTEGATMTPSRENPRFESAPNYVVIDAVPGTRFTNTGYWGMNLQQDSTYRMRVILRPESGYKGGVSLVLLDSKGGELARRDLGKLKNGRWNDVTGTIHPEGSDTRGQLALEFSGSGKVSVDFVSLMPAATFHGHANGLRADVAGMLEGLHPAFVRWPGGCVVEGITTGNRYEWKKSLGDPASRPGMYSTWGYHCTYGFGYHEMLQFCEDIGADAMFVCSVGIGCQYRMADADPDMDFYLQDCLDAIEYALGDVSTTWGKRRAEDGHPAPFPLKYVEIGNENNGPEYDRRHQLFHDSIKARWPQVTLISNHGLAGIPADLRTDMIDPHWYVTPDYFLRNTDLFDKEERGRYEVYVGEYACNGGVGSGNMEAALSEAAWIGGMERNGDLVTMASYAPLLENSNRRNWSVNLIWLDTDQVFGRSSYYVQQMAAENRPTYNVGLSTTTNERHLTQFGEGRIGFGSWDTKAEFKDAVVTLPDGTKTDVLSSLTTEVATPYKHLLDGSYGPNYSLRVKARSLSGQEGFCIYAFMDERENGLLFNIGGWGNTRTAVQDVHRGNNGESRGTSADLKVEQNRWYDIRIDVAPQQAKLYVDGEEVLTTEPELSTPVRFYAAGYDEENGELIVKAVNTESEPYALQMELQGAKSVGATGKAVTLSAPDDQLENTFDAPKRIAPVAGTVQTAGSTLTHTLPPFSYTILRIPAALP